MKRAKEFASHAGPLRVAAYTRVSSVAQALKPDASLASQKAQIEAWLRSQKAKGREVRVRWFEDAGRSGAEGKPRPGFAELEKAVASGQIDVVVTHGLSRLSRSMRDFLTFSRLCEDHNANIVAFQENIDLSTVMGRTQARLLITLWEFEVEIDRVRSRESHQHRVLTGRFAGGPFPLGLTTAEDGGADRARAGILVKERATWPTAERVFDAFLAEGSLRKAADRLRAKGVLDPSRTARKSRRERAAKPFTPTRLLTILRDCRYVGKQRAPAWWFEDNDLTEQDHDRKPEYRDQPASWPAYIPAAKFARVQTALAANREARGNTLRGTVRDHAKFPLSGIATCGLSGLKLTGTTTKKRGGDRTDVYTYYHVDPTTQRRRGVKETVRIRSDELEPLVFERIKMLAADADLMAHAERQAREERREQHRDQRARLGDLEAEVREAREAKRKVLQAIEQGADGAAQDDGFVRGLRERFHALAAREAAVEEDVKSARAELVERPLGPKGRRRLAQRLAKLTRVAEKMQKGELAALYDAFISRLEVFPDRVKLGLRSVPTETILRPPRDGDRGPGPIRRPKPPGSFCVVSGSPRTTLFITTLCPPAAPAGLARLLHVALDVKERQHVTGT